MNIRMNGTTSTATLLLLTLLLLRPGESTHAQEYQQSQGAETEAAGTERTLTGLSQEAAPGLFSVPSPAVTRSGHLVIGTTVLAEVRGLHGYRMPFAVGYGIARYSQAFARFVNGVEEDEVERDRILVGFRLFLGAPMGISFAAEAFGNSVSEWPASQPQRSGVGGGLRLIAGGKLPLGLQMSVFGGTLKEAFLPLSGQAGASIVGSVFQQTLIGAEAFWQNHQAGKARVSVAAGVRVFLFEHLQLSLAYQITDALNASDRRILAGLTFSSDMLRTSVAEDVNELPPELPGLEQLDTPKSDGANEESGNVEDPEKK